MTDGKEVDIVGCVGLHPCTVGDRRYGDVLQAAYMTQARRSIMTYHKEISTPLPIDLNRDLDYSLPLPVLELEKAAESKAREWATNEGELRRMSVARGIRSARVGTLLVSALAQQAKQLGYTHIHLTTGVLMGAAQQFYQSIGFTNIGHILHPQSFPPNTPADEKHAHLKRLAEYTPSPAVTKAVNEKGGLTENTSFYFEEVHFRVNLSQWSGIDGVAIGGIYTYDEIRTMKLRGLDSQGNNDSNPSFSTSAKNLVSDMNMKADLNHCRGVEVIRNVPPPLETNPLHLVRSRYVYNAVLPFVHAQLPKIIAPYLILHFSAFISPSLLVPNPFPHTLFAFLLFHFQST